MAKIFYVERNDIHRELTADHLERRAHEVIKFIPEYYFQSQLKDEGCISLNSTSDFVARIRADHPEVLLIDQESFHENNPAQDYIAAVFNAEYTGKLVLIYNTPINWMEDKLKEHFQRVMFLSKPFSFPHLDQILTSD